MNGMYGYGNGYGYAPPYTPQMGTGAQMPQRCQVIKVNGRNGADAFRMAADSLPIAAARHSAPSTALTQILKRSSQRLKNRSLNSVLPNSRRVLPALKWITVCMA